jgi:cytochrome c-type biogenesis protein CcsB
MQEVNLITLFFYLLSVTAYVAYLFFQHDRLQKTGYLLMLAGFLCHSISLCADYFLTGFFPGRNLHQTLLMAGWAFSGVFLLLQYQFNLKILGIYASPLAAGIMGMTLRTPVAAGEAATFFKSFWLFFHVITMFLGNAAFALACGIGCLYLIQEHGIKAKRRGFFFKRLPSLDMLDTTGHGCIMAGFTLLTIGLVAGILYAKVVWGRFWSWDVKEVWSGIMWLFYAALLHERLTVGWRGRKAATMSIIGFVVLLFTFFGVNFLLGGHHGEFTQW